MAELNLLLKKHFSLFYIKELQTLIWVRISYNTFWYIFSFPDLQIQIVLLNCANSSRVFGGYLMGLFKKIKEKDLDHPVLLIKVESTSFFFS